MRRPGGWLDRGWMARAALTVAVALSPLAFSPPAAARQAHGPEAAAKYKAQAEQLQGAGKAAEALRYFKAAYEADPSNIGNGEDYGKALFTAGRFDSAAALFRELATKDDPAANWNLGYALRKTGDYAGAAEAYAAYEKASPDDPDGYFTLAECLRKLNRFQDAADQYDLYVQKETRASEQDWIAKAKKRSAEMKTAAAQAATTTVAAPGGETVTIAMPTLGSAAPPAAAPAPAPVVVAAAPAPEAAAPTTRDPNAAITRIRDGDVLFKQGRYQEALLAYQDAVNLDDQSTNAILKEGLAYANMGYFREAVAMWEHVLQIDPNNPYAPRYLAKAKPRIDPAAPAYDPTAARPVQATGETGAAVVTASAAPATPSHEVSPEDEAAAKEAYRTAVHDMGAQQYEAAITLLESAIQKNPAYTNAYIARGGAYFGLHRYQEAVADYQKALGMTNALATPLYGLARAYDRLGDKAAACGFYQRYASSTAVDVQANLRKQAQDQITTSCQ